MSAAEDLLAYQLKAVGIDFMREFKFHPKRKWRADFLVDKGILVEIQGGIWVRGAHSGGKGQLRDMEKLNEAQLLGFKLLQFAPQQIKSGEALKTIERALV